MGASAHVQRPNITYLIFPRADRIERRSLADEERLQACNLDNLTAIADADLTAKIAEANARHAPRGIYNIERISALLRLRPRFGTMATCS